MEATTKRPPFKITRVPSLMVIYGQLLYNQGGYEKLINEGDEFEYKKHGRYIAEYLGDHYGVIHHETPSGKVWKIFIPPHKTAYVSDGKWFFMDRHVYTFMRWFMPRFGEEVELVQELTRGSGVRAKFIGEAGYYKHDDGRTEPIYKVVTLKGKHDELVRRDQFRLPADFLDQVKARRY